MKIVSNASALINLARIRQLDLLRQLYGELIIPEAVWHEVVVEGTGQPGADEVSQLIVYEKCFKRAFVHVTDMARAIIRSKD